MVSRERLLSLGETFAERATAIRENPAVRVLGRLATAAIVVLLAVRLWQLWRRHPVDFGHLDGAIFAGAVAVSVVAVSAYGLVWPYLLRRLGTPAPLSWVTLFFKSQLGKYIPGSVWQYAGRIGLARNRGVPVKRAALSIAAEIGYSALAAAATASLLLSGAASAGVFFAVAGTFVLGAFLLRRVGSGRPVSRETLVAALGVAPAAVVLYLVVWAIYGLAFWMTGRALFAIPAADLPHYMGVFALAWLAGLVAVFAPGGIGVREAVIVALLSGRLHQADAIVLAATSRIVLTATDLVLGAASFGLPALRRGDPRPLGADR
jgi:glycosyltransferase 2 family protein